MYFMTYLNFHSLKLFGLFLTKKNQISDHHSSAMETKKKNS